MYTACYFKKKITIYYMNKICYNIKKEVRADKYVKKDMKKKMVVINIPG